MVDPVLWKDEIARENCDVDRHWTVYVHINKINNKVYVGITGKQPKERWNSGHGYHNQVFGKAIKKYGWDNFEHNIVATGLLKEEAYKMESDLIRELEATNSQYGYNISTGGDQPTIDRRKKCYQYDLDGNFINEWDSITDAAQAIGVRQTVLSNALSRNRDGRCMQYLFSFEYKEKLNPAIKVKSKDIPILQYDLLGRFVASYNSLSDFLDLLDKRQTIVASCLDRKKSTALGYRWYYEDKFDEDMLHEDIMLYKSGNKFKYHSYHIDQFDLQGNYIATYKNFYEMADVMKFSNGQMQLILKKSQNTIFTFKEYQWMSYLPKGGGILTPVLYLQHDKRWAEHDYSAKGEKTTIKAEGCGIACSAMVIATLVDNTVTPLTTSDWSKANGYKAPHQGTYYSYFEPQFKKYGLKCRMVNSKNCYHDPKAKCHKEALAAIDNGDFVIACMGKGNWTTSGHYVVWYGMEGNNVLINDPWSVKKQQTNASYDLFCNEVKYYWIISVPDKYKEDGIMVVEDIIMVDGKEHKIQMVRKDGYTYLNTRQLCEILGYDVDSEGRIPVVKTTKKK